MLDGLFLTPAVTAIEEALASARASDGPLVIVGNAKLAKVLAERREPAREVIVVGLSERAAKKLTNALPDTGSIASRSCAAVVGIDVVDDDAWEDTLRAWSRCVRDGGAIVFVDKGHAEEASRRALCAGLSEIE
ncbi:MAG: hypothetical protein AB7L94_41420, partial [Kofleriaceae bacterium]